MSARYTPLPDINYTPTIERLLQVNSQGKNKQSNNIGGVLLSETYAAEWLKLLDTAYAMTQEAYRFAQAVGISNELARLPVPVARYSRMRVSGNLRNWMQFLTLRMAENAQYEIREYADVVCGMLSLLFPRTMELFKEGSNQ